MFERDAKVGGLLRFGIPDFKLEKRVIDRRVAILEEEGITFKTNAHVGKNISVETRITSYNVCYTKLLRNYITNEYLLKKLIIT